MKIFHPLHKVVLYGMYGTLLALFGGHEQIGGIDAIKFVDIKTFTRKHIELFDGLYFIVPELYPYGYIIVGQINVHVFTLDTETAASQLYVIAGVKAFHQLA